MHSYKIAGHVVRISGGGQESLPGFGYFLSEETSDNPLLTIHLDAILQDWDISPTFVSEYEEMSYDLSGRDGAYLFRVKHPNGNRLLAEIRSEGDGFRARVHRTGTFGDEVLHFVCWLLFGIAALSRQTVSIHSSAIMNQGKTMLFLGESGTGKSTHTRLWLNHISGTELLNDDSPFIRIKTDGDVWVYGSPWSGKTPCYKNKQTPVAAFIRLSQAPYNRIRRLKGIEAIGALLPSCPFAFAYDKQLSESVCEIVSHTLQQVPIYHLECLPDVDAAQLVYSTLKENGHL